MLKWAGKKLRRLAPIVLAFGLLFGGVVAVEVATSVPALADTCGNPGPPLVGVLLAGSSWLTGDGGGVNVYENLQPDGSSYGYVSCYGESTVNNVNGVPEDAGGGWQCVELVNRLYLTKGWIMSHWSGNGDTLVNSLPAGLSKQNNGGITSIVPGDVVTFDGNADNTAGHAGVVSSVSGNSVTIENQNAGSAVTQTVTYNPSNGTLGGEYGYTTQAVIHAAANTGSGIENSGYETTFQANTGALYLYGNAYSGASNPSVGVASGSSPAIAAVSNGYEVAFQANTGALNFYGNAYSGATTLGLMAGTSPSIATESSGYEVAAQTNGGSLLIYGSIGTNIIGDGLMAGTSPSVAGYLVAFQANTGYLFIYNIGNGQTSNVGLPMAAGTSPAVSLLPGGGYQIAYQSNAGNLVFWNTVNGYVLDTGLGMAAGTSPALAEVPSGYEAAIQANTGTLWFYGTAFSGQSNPAVGLMAGTSPSIAPVTSGYEVAYQDNVGNLEVYGTAYSGDINAGMASGTSPGIE